jgi:hypothetical protein
MYSSSKVEFNFLKNVIVFFAIIVFLVLPSIVRRYIPFFTTFPNVVSFLLFTYYFEEERKYFLYFIFGFIFDVLNVLPFGFSSCIWLINLSFTGYFKKSINFNKYYFLLFDFLNMFFSFFTMLFLYQNTYSFWYYLWQYIVNGFWFIIFFNYIYTPLNKRSKVR